MKDKQRLFEIIAVIITGAGKYVFIDLLEQRLIFIISVILFWIVYLIIRMSPNNGIHKYWGLSFLNITPTLKIVGILTIIFSCVIVTYGLIFKEPKLSINILWALLTYPIWGLLQQFLTMSLFAGNLKDLRKIKLNKYLIVALTCFMFSIVHYPKCELMIPTFFMAIIYSLIFLKHRNIIPLGIAHGILGSLYYYFVLIEDPWMDMICAICN